MSKTRILGIIPARSGSKRLVGKNVKDLAGKALIEWTIDAAKECALIDELMVTTDDVKIADIAHERGAKVPFIRPKELATDTSSSIDAVLHALEHYQNNNQQFQYVMLLQPTSPLRQSRHIYESIELLKSKKADAIVSVCETEHSPLWASTLDEEGDMTNFIADEVKNKRSQDLPKYYRLNGAIYIVSVEKLLNEKSFIIKENIYAYVMDSASSVDIDTELDFQIAELLLKRKNLNEN